MTTLTLLVDYEDLKAGTVIHVPDDGSVETLINQGIAKRPLIYQGMYGLGDNIYTRAVIRELGGDVFLETPWPQLFEDLPVHCVKAPMSRLRTQNKNIVRSEAIWYPAPHGAVGRSIGYVNKPGTILEALCDSVGVLAQRITFDLPKFASERRPDRYIVIRPATIRSEWRADSRNARPEYLARAAEMLRPHFRIISVADLSLDEEWAECPLPYADETYHAGELPVEDLMALVAGAAGVVGSVGWLVPAAVAYRIPMFLIFGGCGLHHGPARIFDDRIDISRIHQALPDRFCHCGIADHACDKEISTIDEQLRLWIVRLAEERSVAVAPRARGRVVSSSRESLRSGVL